MVGATVRGLSATPKGMLEGALLASSRGRAATRGRNIAILPRAAALVDVIRRRRPDHLHVHWGGASSTMAMIASEATGTPWSMTLHRWDIYADNLLARKLDSACFTRVISKSSAARVASVVPGANVEVIHMGIEVPPERVPLQRPEPRERRLACIASLIPVKNHAGLLRAFQTIAFDHDLALDLVGDGTLRPRLAALVTELGLDDRVRFLGTLAHEQILRKLGSGDWFAVVLASLASADEHEGIPVSLMEAMAAGVPVVATDSGGTSELIGGGAGLLVPVGDVDALADALRGIVSDQELRRAASEGGRRRVAESFDVDVIAAELRRRFSACET
jgi:glycosyltransferase involved in cell wall biosynthesis